MRTSVSAWNRIHAIRLRSPGRSVAPPSSLVVSRPPLSWRNASKRLPVSSQSTPPKSRWLTFDLAQVCPASLVMALLLLWAPLRPLIVRGLGLAPLPALLLLKEALGAEDLEVLEYERGPLRQLPITHL